MIPPDLKDELAVITWARNQATKLLENVPFEHIDAPIELGTQNLYVLVRLIIPFPEAHH